MVRYSAFECKTDNEANVPYLSFHSYTERAGRRARRPPRCRRVTRCYEMSAAETAPPSPATPLRVRVRNATRDDMPLVHTMIHELAAFEGMPDGPQLSVADLIADGFESSPPWFFALVAEVEVEGGAGVVGYALCTRAYSSWTRRALYLEDLYVREEARGAGVGRALLAGAAARGVALGAASRMDWHVLESNAGALRLYARLGARCMRASEGRAALRLDAPALAALAALAAPAASDIQTIH